MALLKRKRSGLGDAMEVVTRFVNACNRHDADGVYSCLHPDFDSIQPMYPSRNFRGADQVRRNWQAIFDAEPGFRLTVLRSAAVDDTIWLELHGAGQDAEVAGVFVMGIQGDRIRWARIYSALVEPVPEGVGEPPAPLREVPRTDQPVAAGDGEVVQEALIAPVLDMDRGGRRRRRRRGAGDGEAEDAAEDTAAGAGDGEVTAVVSGDADMEAAAVVGGDDQASTVVGGGDQASTVVEGDDQASTVVGGDDQASTVVGGDDQVTAVVEGQGEVSIVVESADDAAVVVADDDAAVAVAGDDVAVAVDAGPQSDVVVVADEPEAEVLVAGPADDDGGPATEAVDMVTITTEEPEATVDPEATPAGDDPDDPPRRGLFGRKR
jgi:ketosteroid isomerase-like protein